MLTTANTFIIGSSIIYVTTPMNQPANSPPVHLHLLLRQTTTHTSSHHWKGIATIDGHLQAAFILAVQGWRNLPVAIRVLVDFKREYR